MPSLPSPPTNAQSALRALLGQAVKLHQAGQLDEAIRLYRKVLSSSSRSFDALHMLGVALVQQKKTAEGISSLRKAVQVSPDSMNCKLNLGNALVEARNFTEACSLFQSLLTHGQANAQVVRGLLQCLNELERTNEALEFGKKAVARFPQVADVLNEYGRTLANAGLFREAAEVYRRALSLKPGYQEAACNLGNTLTELKLFDEAEKVLGGALKANPQNVQALTNLAHLHRANWQAEKAMAVARKAIEIKSGDAGLETFVGGCLIDLGRNDEAEAVFRDMIGSGQQLHDALIGLSQVHKFKSGEPEIAMVKQLLDGPAMAPKERRALLFAQAKMEDDLGNHGAAVAAATAAKAVEPFDMPFDAYRDYITECMRLMDKDFFDRNRGAGNSSEQPVFIIGMPRSGTTLTEQIIASHPLADGAGELTAFPAIAEEIGFRRMPPRDLVNKLAAMTPDNRQLLSERYLAILGKDKKAGALRITDKLPHNFETIWLAKLLFPNSRVIVCDRNPVDISISIFLRNFSAGHWYAQDLATLGKFYMFYRQQVSHWKAVCDLQWFENDYEALVSEPEPNIRKLIDFLGLPWDERCLSHTETERSVHTFSKVQVRQPIYKSSVERWRKYAPYIGPLLKELGVSAT